MPISLFIAFISLYYLCLDFIYFDIDLRTFYLKESEVIIEELQDDDSFEYSNMPALINLPSPLYLSHTQPPFIYQYVGDQVKILQVLGNYPNVSANNQTDNNTNHWDQKEVTNEELSLQSSIDKENITDDSVAKIEDIINKQIDSVSDIPVLSQHKDKNDDQSSTYKDNVEVALANTDKQPVYTAVKQVATVVLDEHTESTSLETSLYDNDSVESDDEASFGTPENSPKSKRKSPKGKYGKGKAPPPPKADEATPDDNKEDCNKSDIDTILESTASQESLVDIVNKLPNTTIKESGLPKSLQIVNPIAENKIRHKSKSPARLSKGSPSGLGKLLQLPGKLAFWHKTEEKPKLDDASTSSDDHSRRSSTIERAVDDFQSCTELNTLVADEAIVQSNTTEETSVEKSEEQISFIDASDLDNEVISQDVMDKSDALQKLIDAKIAGHPEYKFISLHDETPTSSKSTDV